MPWSMLTYSKFWSILLGHFIKHKHLFFCTVTSIICKRECVSLLSAVFLLGKSPDSSNLWVHFCIMCTTDCRDNTTHIFSQLQKLHNAWLKIDMKKCILGRRGMLKSRIRCVFSSSFWMGVAHSFLNLKGFLLCEFLHYMKYMDHCISKLTVFWPLKSKYINTIWHFFVLHFSSPFL